MELGDFFGGVLDLGQSYLASKFNASPGPFIGPIQPMGFATPASIATPGWGGASGGGGPPPAPPGNGGDGCGPSPVYKKVCGVYKWVYPKRRRRRQLITLSDAAGLAKLKGIVGQGKTMDVWIATHGSK